MDDLDAFLAAVRAIDKDAGPARPTSVRRRASVADALGALVALGHGESANAVSEAALVRHLRQKAHELAVEAHYDEYPEDRPSRAEVAAVRLRRADDALAEDLAALRQAEELLRAAQEDDPTVDEVIAAARALAGSSA